MGQLVDIAPSTAWQVDPSPVPTSTTFPHHPLEKQKLHRELAGPLPRTPNRSLGQQNS